MAEFSIRSGKLQGDLDANGKQILNLNLAGLNLTPSSVGLGNVDNTRDSVKITSQPTLALLAQKEPEIVGGTNGQFWNGLKAWVTFGALALQGGDTSVQSLSSIGVTSSDVALISARAIPAISGRTTTLERYGTSNATEVLVGVGAANAGSLTFYNTTNAVIKTANSAPLLFGTSGTKRAQILLGLNVGGNVDPGVGCILATGTISAGGPITAAGVLTGATSLSVGTNAAVGLDLTVGGNAAVAGTLLATLNLQAGGNLAIAGNAVINGFLLSRPPSFTNSGCPVNTVFYSIDDAKLSYRDAGGTVHALY